jgi:Cdc6-like AAA superfamily ATPase
MDHHHVSVFIDGRPGVGKSMMGYFISREFQKGSLCNSFHPWHPGDRFDELYDEAHPSEDSPLIVVFDEIDEALKKIVNGIPKHQNIPTFISCKNEWNKFLDDINLGIYPFVIIIMTSNVLLKKINQIDPSILRNGRVNISLSFN